MNPELSRELKLIKQRLDDLEQNRREVPLGLSLAAYQALTGSAADVTFDTIPTGFRHLKIICQARTDVSAENDGIILRFNADSGSSYDWQRLGANSTTVTGLSTIATTSIQVGQTEGANSRGDNFSPTEIMIYGYNRTDNEKWIMSRNAAFGDASVITDLFVQTRAGRWRNTAAITFIRLFPLVGPNFVAGSEFQLYGVR